MVGIDIKGNYASVWLFPVGIECYYLSSTKSFNISLTLFKISFKFTIGENYTLFGNDSSI